MAEDGYYRPFLKKETALPSNNRGISLSAIASKIYNKLLLKRVVPEVENCITVITAIDRKYRDL